MNRVNIIQVLIDKYHYKHFLEIGTRDGACLNAIKCDLKIGVDPDESSAANVHMTSDEFFNNLTYAGMYQKKGSKETQTYLLKHKGIRTNIELPINGKFDIIFIDGLHHSEQVIKDILNSLEILNEGGAIVMHDCLPTSEFMQIIPMQPDHNEWTGDTWKAFVRTRMTRSDLVMEVVDTDYGCGIIKKNTINQNLKWITLLEIEGNLDYEGFVKNKQKWMNIISVSEFKQKYLD